MELRALLKFSFDSFSQIIYDTAHRAKNIIRKYSLFHLREKSNVPLYRKFLAIFKIQNTEGTVYQPMSTKSAKKNKWTHIWGNIESFNIFNVKKIFNPSEPPSLEENIPDKEKNSRYINKKLPIQSMFYGLGFIILFMGVLKIFRFICIVLILAMFSCFMLLPIIRFIVKKTKINRTFISAIISIIYTAILLSIGWIILNSLIGFFSNFGLYEKQLNTIITDIIYNLNNLTKNLDQNLLSNNFPHIKFSLSDYIIKRLSFNFYLDSANNLFTFISGVGLICLFVFFMLNEAEKTDIKLKVIFKERAYKFIYQNLEIISAKISRYLQLKTIVSGLTAFLVWLILNFFK